MSRRDTGVPLHVQECESESMFEIRLLKHLGRTKLLVLGTTHVGRFLDDLQWVRRFFSVVDVRRLRGLGDGASERYVLPYVLLC